tara:strand:+ start:85 stop:1572 length:1488 start_codon:yes stop_codon:yes gene_type:complete
MSRRGQKRRVEASDDENDERLEEEEEVHGAHATVQRGDDDEIIPVPISQEVVDCFMDWGNGDWGESTINLNRETVHMNKASVARMKPDDVQSVLESLLQMAGFNYDPANNKMESKYTGYICTPNLKTPDNRAEIGYMQVFDGEVVDKCVSVFETSAPVRKQVIQVALSHFTEELARKNEGMPVQDIVMIKVIMEELLGAIPNPEAVARTKQRMQNIQMKALQKGVVSFRKFSKQAGEEVAKNKQMMANEAQRERMFQETLGLHQRYTESCKEVLRADETAKVLGPTVDRMNRELMKIFDQINHSVELVPTAQTGAPPLATDSIAVLQRKYNELLVKENANEATQKEAKKLNEKLYLEFRSVGSQLKQITAIFGSEGWAKTKCRLTTEKHKKISTLERELLVQGHIMEEAKSGNNMSRLEQAISNFSNIFKNFGQIGASRFHENDANDAGSGSADNHHGEGSGISKRARRGGGGTGAAEGGGAAATGARRTSRRGQ